MLAKIKASFSMSHFIKRLQSAFLLRQVQSINFALAHTHNTHFHFISLKQSNRLTQTAPQKTKEKDRRTLTSNITISFSYTRMSERRSLLPPCDILPHSFLLLLLHLFFRRLISRRILLCANQNLHTRARY